MERTVRYTLMLGESSDKPLESGIQTFTEVVNFVPLIPADDAQGGVQTVPGWRIYGENSFTFIPGVSPEDETQGGEPAASASVSASYRRIVDRAFVLPEVLGTIFLGVYSSDGEDAETGRVAYVYQEQWGNESPAVGDRSEPLPARVCDFLAATVTAPTIPVASLPAVPTSAYTMVFSNADPDATLFDIYTGSTSGALTLVDADIPNTTPGDEISRDLTTLFPYDSEAGSFEPGTYYYRVVSKDDDGCEVSTAEYTLTLAAEEFTLIFPPTSYLTYYVDIADGPATLSWDYHPLDEGDVDYEVYTGTSAGSLTLAGSTTGTSFDPGFDETLVDGKSAAAQYHKVVVRKLGDIIAESPVRAIFLFDRGANTVDGAAGFYCIPTTYDPVNVPDFGYIQAYTASVGFPTPNWSFYTGTVSGALTLNKTLSSPPGVFLEIYASELFPGVSDGDEYFIRVDSDILTGGEFRRYFYNPSVLA